ncbi:arylsulfatase [Pontiella sulfatireligans]|nr:arylsulfatase [Pontiella sulfatireligans]
MVLSVFVIKAPGLAATRPNVILILTDDQGYGDYGCHGNPLLKTPNIDKLHGESIRLTDFHVAPMCTPTRGQLMTGMDAVRNGASAVCQGRSMMGNDIKIMPQYFAEAGYSTGHFGKWHLGDSYPHRPQDRGFEETLHHPAWGITSLPDHFGNTYWDPYLNHNGTEKRYKGYSTDIFFREAMAWMKAKKKSGKPFFLYLPTNTPHVPNWVDVNYSKPYADVGTYNGVKVPSNFYGMIANIDENMAKLDAFLLEEGLKEDTVLIYLNDNGSQSFEASEIYNAGMQGFKRGMLDGGHRVGCFWRWPNGLTPGRDVDDLIQVQDILPTLAELCELPKPSKDINGTSIAKLLQGKKSKLKDRKIVIQYSNCETSALRWDHAIVLWGKWRLVGSGALYNVKTDPHQDKNVVSQYPDIAQAMREHYEQWYAEARIRFDKPRYITVGSDAEPSLILFSNDWQGGYCDNPPNLVEANTMGYWDIDVAEAGKYEFELRRWPESANLPLCAGVQGETIKAHESFSGYVGARPIHFANIQVAGFQGTKVAEKDATHVRFAAELKAGKTKLSTLFSDVDGNPLCSAIYVKVTRL